jgi:uncharacterized protein (TIGR02246 family)
VADSKRADEERLRSLPKIFSDAVNNKDAYALSEIMADDVDYVNVDAALMRGRADVEKHHVAGFSGFLRASIFEVLQISIRFLRPDIAFVHWSWTATGDIGRDGLARPRRYGVMTMVAEKQADDWKVVAVQNTNSFPGGKPQAGVVSPMPLPNHTDDYRE